MPLAAGTATVHDPLTGRPEDHPLFSLIGRVNAHWAQFEHILDLVVWDLARHRSTGMTDEKLACMTSQITGAQSKCVAIQALLRCQGLPTSLLDVAKKVKNGIHGPQEARNRIVHDAWFVGVSSGATSRFKKMSRDEPEFGLSDITADSIEETIVRIKERIAEAEHLRVAALAALSASP